MHMLINSADETSFRSNSKLLARQARHEVVIVFIVFLLFFLQSSEIYIQHK